MTKDTFTIFSSFTYFDTALLVAVFISFLVVMWYYIFSFLKISTFNIKKIKTIRQKNMPISIVVIVRDDLIFLTTRIHALFAQNYQGEFQVVVVNFKSQDDETAVALDNLKAQYPLLYITNVKHTHNYQHTTKLAYTLGIKAAAHEFIIFLSPRAHIMHEKWLEECSKGFMRSDMISGYTRLTSYDNMSNKIARCKNVVDSLLYMGSANIGLPYFANEMFFGFTRPLFYKCKGFATHLRLNRGENDLFIQQAAKFSSLTPLLSRRSTVEINEPVSYQDHLDNIAFSTYAQKYYKIGPRLYMFNFFLFSTIFYLSALLSLILLPLTFKIVVAVAAFIQFIISLVIVLSLSARTKENIPFMTMLFYQYIMAFESLIIFIKQRFRPSRNLWI